MQVARNSSEMENHVFTKAKTREEYMNMVAKLILHVREMCKCIFSRKMFYLIDVYSSNQDSISTCWQLSLTDVESVITDCMKHMSQFQLSIVFAPKNNAEDCDLKMYNLFKSWSNRV